MARQLIRALEGAGYETAIASRLRSRLATGEDRELAALSTAAAAERSRLLACYEAGDPRPELWVTYHPYYKAPDLIGPQLCAALGIPYVTIEASHAAKRGRDGWRASQALVESALECGALHICFTARDKAGLDAFLRSGSRTALLPPFLADAPDVPAPPRDPDGPVECIAVAMMRSGDKLASYRFLAEALAPITALPWRLTIVGDGPERPTVEAAFGAFPHEKVRFAGLMAADAIPPLLAGADLYLWPGLGEAFGMAYLEAAAQGLPAVALDVAGVASVVVDGLTGLLVRLDPTCSDLANAGRDAYRAAVVDLIGDGGRRRAMSEAARHFARQERSLAQASGRLATLLAPALHEVRKADDDG